MRINGQLGTGQASPARRVSAGKEGGGALKGQGEEMGARGIIFLPSEEEISGAMEQLDLTSWEWLDMIILEYRGS